MYIIVNGMIMLAELGLIAGVAWVGLQWPLIFADRKSTRLNSSHG